ncbi:methylaspartate mutase [Solihabitans fulvus]|uniref:Methylaspartate mutase n=1 Tax=Solihabitans fulvus TaxID=1892852 RepID=A0A5B2WWY0_9PSEU|nr:methylaspartate mutase [Solihabitans fulvus]KAA2254457.1 methylaspartate mutase [Solihabitans fulvus]
MSGSFAGFVRDARRRGNLVVQPRMGFSDPAEMRAGLLATKRARATAVGTVTLDSYTRVGDHDAVARALAEGLALNGYPIVDHDPATTDGVLAGVRDETFPVQVRHGSPLPESIFAALVSAGLDATEGGPVSYCLPYSRAPLKRAVRSWARCCERFATLADRGVEPHLESFGGCLLGQLCPPSLLLAMTVLEGMFFRQHGIRSMSLSFTQQTSAAQDEEALRGLHRLIDEYLSDVDSHVVLYAYMGVHPRTPAGSFRLLADATRLAVRGGAARLIVKTPAEAHRIPTIRENVAALEYAAEVAVDPATRRLVGESVADTGVHAEARALIEAVLDLHDDLGTALLLAFAAGYLDVPYCLHADNRGRARARVDGAGRLRWTAIGSMPIGHLVRPPRDAGVTSAELLSSLHYVERKYDRAALHAAPTRELRAHELDAGPGVAAL